MSETDKAFEAWRSAEFPSTTKPTNPKDSIGSSKVPLVSVVPQRVLAELGLALLEGAAKYGRHNYRTAGVRASVYVDALGRHLGAWWEGQDLDPDSGLSHVTKAIACLVVLRDSMQQGNWQDDRPPRASDAETWTSELNALAKKILERYPNPLPAHTQASALVEPLDPLPKPCASCGGFAPRACQDC